MDKLNNQIEVLSDDYIIGIVEKGGSFSFSTTSWKLKSGLVKKRKIPAFVITTNEDNKNLLVMIKNGLGLKNKIYSYKEVRKDGRKITKKAILTVREFMPLKNIVVPFFYGKLRGKKAKQFEAWLEQIGNNPAVSEKFKFIYKLHKWGHYSKNKKS